MNKKVLVVGELNVDLILNGIQGLPKIGAERLADSMHLTLGSSAAIFASNLCVQHVEVSFLGMIGSDQFGELVSKAFEKKGVSTNLLIKTEEHNTGVTVVMNYDMDRAMVTYPGAMEHLSYEHFDKLDLSVYDHLHVSSVFLQPLIKKSISQIFKKAKDNNLTTSLDTQWDPNEKWDLVLPELLPHVDIFLPNEKEFLALTKATTIARGIEIISPYANLITIKNGEHGASVTNGNDTISRPAFLNESVEDCIGAGDSFNAGFVYAYIHGEPLEKCLERGNIMGAVSTTKPGGTTAFTTMDDIKNVAELTFMYKI